MSKTVQLTWNFGQKRGSYSPLAVTYTFYGHETKSYIICICILLFVCFPWNHLSGTQKGQKKQAHISCTSPSLPPLPGRLDSSGRTLLKTPVYKLFSVRMPQFVTHLCLQRPFWAKDSTVFNGTRCADALTLQSGPLGRGKSTSCQHCGRISVLKLNNVTTSHFESTARKLCHIKLPLQCCVVSRAVLLVLSGFLWRCSRTRHCNASTNTF